MTADRVIANYGDESQWPVQGQSRAIEATKRIGSTAARTTATQRK